MQTQNLLDTLQLDTRPPRTDRIALLAALPPDGVPSAEIGAWVTNFVRAHASVPGAGGGGQGSPADATQGSGILLLFEAGAVLVMEHGADVITALVAELARVTRSTNPDAEAGILFESAVVLASVDDVRRRHYPLFAIRELSLSRAERYDVDMDDHIGVASSMYAGLLQLGTFLSAQFEKGSDPLSRALDNLRSDPKTAALLPVASTVSLLLNSDAVASLADFIAVFEGPVDLALDSEIQYPPPFDEWFLTGLDTDAAIPLPVPAVDVTQPTA